MARASEHSMALRIMGSLVLSSGGLGWVGGGLLVGRVFCPRLLPPRRLVPGKAFVVTVLRLVTSFPLDAFLRPPENRPRSVGPPRKETTNARIRSDCSAAGTHTSSGGRRHRLGIVR